MAGSLASATCSPDTRRPTGSARGAGESPRGRAPTASSNSRRVTSWTGWPVSCRHRGSTGIACRLDTSQGCSPRITSSGPPSRHSPLEMSASGVMTRLISMRSADMRWAEIPTGGRCDSCDRPRSHDTSRKSLGQTHGPGRRGVSARVPGVWRRHPTHRVTPKPGPIREFLTYLGEPLEPPTVSPARGPPTDWGEFVQADDDRAIF